MNPWAATESSPSGWSCCARAGAFRALLFAPGLALLASWFPPQRRATAMSLFLLGGAGGSILLSLAGPFLAERYGWRATFIGFAVLGVGTACLYGIFARDRAGSFEWGFIAISAACIVGVVLSVALSHMRTRALAKALT